jgi:hypothetical protein
MVGIVFDFTGLVWSGLVWSGLVFRGVEHDRRIQNLQKKHAEQETRDMEEQKVQALAKSRQILDEAMRQNTEEIFKILVANQEVANSNLTIYQFFKLNM